MTPRVWQTINMRDFSTIHQCVMIASIFLTFLFKGDNIVIIKKNKKTYQLRMVLSQNVVRNSPTCIAFSEPLTHQKAFLLPLE